MTRAAATSTVMSRCQSREAVPARRGDAVAGVLVSVLVTRTLHEGADEW
ncbi:hypothetical protein [Actinomycetospora aeridis]|uniref:Uncharacterized protein n=1 Tax=Actinomycetospora aeridis TaxID=3129231 RepID=A0ABU8NDL7_9PSEU